MILSEKFHSKKFAIYGLGVTGKSVVRFFQKSKFDKFFTWDDDYKKRPTKNTAQKFKKILNEVDYIILSPGIDTNKTIFKNNLKKNCHKIISDIDLFYMCKSNIKTIVVTGTNGKSTTCKLLEHLLKYNNIKSYLGGNIGKPILSLTEKNSLFAIIEVSSFQLANSKFIKPNFAVILNITKDHLDWHKNMRNYENSKFKIFSLQDRKDFAFLSEKRLKKIFLKRKYLSKLKTVSLERYLKIKKRIKNSYLLSKFNEQNMCFAYEISKILKIKDKSFVKTVNSFKGLEHRHEIFFYKKNLKIINDSKATSFEATKLALKSNNNISWIVGGLPKLGDVMKVKPLRNKIIKAYIIGNNRSFFKKQLKNILPFEISKNMQTAIRSIFSDIKKTSKNNHTILLSPASASYDQYSNFMERGAEFKRIAKKYANKFLSR